MTAAPPLPSPPPPARHRRLLPLLLCGVLLLGSQLPDDTLQLHLSGPSPHATTFHPLITEVPLPSRHPLQLPSRQRPASLRARPRPSFARTAAGAGGAPPPPPPPPPLLDLRGRWLSSRHAAGAATLCAAAVVWLGRRLRHRLRQRCGPWRAATALGEIQAGAAADLEGKVMVFVGKFRDGPTKAELQDLVASHGAVVRTAISTRTDLVVLGAGPPESMLVKVRAHNIATVSATDLQASLAHAPLPPPTRFTGAPVSDSAPLLDPDPEGLAETGDEALWAAGPLGPEAEQRAARVQFARRVIAFTGVLPLSRTQLRYACLRLGARMYHNTGRHNLLVVGRRSGRLLDLARTHGIEVVEAAQFMEALKEIHVDPPSPSLAGKTVAFTGHLPVQVRTARRLAEESGAQVVDRAEGQPDVLVCGLTPRRADVQAALQGGREVWAEAEFLAAATQHFLQEPTLEPTGMTANEGDPDAIWD